MKKIKIITIAVISCIFILPLVKFNFEEGAISKIDNRELASNPFKADYSDPEQSIVDNIENYLTDRIGFRNEMINAYTVLNDKVFGIMEHPSYSYGKDGYVFGMGITCTEEYTQYHEDLADAILRMQNYCNDRGVPFVYVLNPAKPAVLREYLAEGINYNREWVDKFTEALDERNVNYVDNTDMLREKMQSGEMVFNKEFDANHWNKLGAYYGTNAVLERLKEDIPTVHVNTMDEMDVSTKKETTLLVSEFPIDEDTPQIVPKFEADFSTTDKYADELEISDQFRTFYYYKNKLRAKEDAPKALVFQGSYMNVYGYDFFANSFSEYIYVHDYQNVFDFDYYFNIFKPECVVFEMAEYTFGDAYFDQEKMNNMNLNIPVKDAWEKYDGVLGDAVSSDSIKVEKGKTLTKLTWTTDKECDNIWMYMNDEFDMRQCEDGYEVTVDTSFYENNKDDLVIIELDNENITAHKVSE